MKLRRAKAHIAELAITCRAFFDCSPYEVRSSIDPHTKERRYFVSKVQDVPSEIAAIAGDALHNIRSALDHLAYRLFLVGTQGTAGEGKHIGFPIFDDAAKFTKGFPGKLIGCRGDAIDAIKALKPYKGGNDILWRLHRLDNIDKHRLLVAIGAANLAHSMPPSQRAEVIRRFHGSYPPDHSSPNLSGVLVSTTTLHFPLKTDDLLLVLPESEVEDFTQFHFDVVFGEPGMVEGQPIGSVLNEMYDLVARIVSGFEPFCR